MQIPWILVDGSLFATAMTALGLPIYHLIAEQLPDQDAWDWAVWLSGASPARHGAATSALVAMSAAQTAARELEAVHPIKVGQHQLLPRARAAGSSRSAFSAKINLGAVRKT